MKKLFRVFLLFPVLSWGQTNMTIQDNTSNITITPDGLRSYRPLNTGLYNTAIGEKVLELNTAGQRNTAVGYSSLNKVNGNSDNTAVGYNALKLTDNVENTAIGAEALSKNTSGNGNTALGFRALGEEFEGWQNIGIGTGAGMNIYGGGYNICIGAGAMGSTSFGGIDPANYPENNVAVGGFSLANCKTGFNNVAIGYQAGASETGSNRLYIENSGTTTPLIGGDFANDVVGINMPIGALASNPTWKLKVGGDINATGSVRAAGVVLTSDRRLKKEIAPLQNALTQLTGLQGVTYLWRKNEFPERHFADKKQTGFIAQEIEKIFPEMVDTDAQGYKSINYIQLTPVLVEAIKELSEQVKTLQNQHKNLEASMEGIFKILKEKGVNLPGAN